MNHPKCPECGMDLADCGTNPASQKVWACEGCLWTNNGHRLGEEPDKWTPDMYTPL